MKVDQVLICAHQIEPWEEELTYFLCPLLGGGGSLKCKKVDVISMFVARKFCDLTSLIVSVARHEVNGIRTLTST